MLYRVLNKLLRSQPNTPTEVTGGLLLQCFGLGCH